MAKQKNRLTTTRQVLARERFAYPVPTIHPKKTVGDETRILLTLEPTLHHSHLISTVSDPPAGESTSRSTKSKLPTLYLPWTLLTLACTGGDIKLNQDKPAYPRPHTSHHRQAPALESILEPAMSKQPTLHRPTHSRPDSTELLSTEFHQV